MKMILNAKRLKEALTCLSKVVSSKAAPSILKAVKFSGTRDGITVTATNLDETLTFHLEGEGTGSFILNLKDLKEYLKNCKDSVQFEDIWSGWSGAVHT